MKNQLESFTYKFLSILPLMALFIITLSSCSQKMQIGNENSGGVVIYIDESGQHGIIAAEKDLQGEYSWDNAKYACTTLKLNGYSDWRLPNKSEMRQIFLNRKVIDDLSVKDSTKGFSGGQYWTSTEHQEGSEYAWEQYIDNGKQFGAPKNLKLNVRPIRSF